MADSELFTDEVMYDNVKKLRPFPHGGAAVKCPRCGAEDISGGPFDCENDYVWQTVSCAACSFYWKEVYAFSFAEAEDET